MQFKVSDSKPAVMYNVLYVPDLACNLFSVRAGTQRGNFVKFGRTKCWIRGQSGSLLGMGSLSGKLYRLDCTCDSVPPKEQANATCEQTADLWHQRLGHINEKYLTRMTKNEVVTGMKISKTKLTFCEGCVEGKTHRQPFKSVGENSSRRKLQLIHSDVCGPMTESIGGSRYFVTFIDDYSRCCAVYFMKSKSEVFERFKEFEAIVVNQSGQKIGTLRSDNGGEYLSKEFETYLKSNGITHQLTIAYSPEQNGVAERMNRTLMESARAMMSYSGLSEEYWAEAVATAAYVRNRSASSALKNDETPYERWYGKKPDISHLRVFGCIAYAHIPDSQRRKLDKKTKKYRFVGYCKNSKGYRLIDEETKRVVSRRDVVFNEMDFGRRSTLNSNQQMIVELNSEDQQEKTVEDSNQPSVRRSERERRPPVRYGVDE